MKITKYRKSDKEGSLLGYFSMSYVDQYGERFINDMKLFRNRDGHQFIVHPDRSYQVEGVTKFSPYTGYTERPFSDKFQNDVLRALQDFFDNPTSNSTQEQRSGHEGGKESEIKPFLNPYPHVHSNVQSKSDQEELPF